LLRSNTSTCCSCNKPCCSVESSTSGATVCHLSNLYGKMIRWIMVRRNGIIDGWCQLTGINTIRFQYRYLICF
jgi:hypothetical protein